MQRRAVPLLAAATLLAAAGVAGVFEARAGQPGKQKTPEQQGKELWERHCTACHGPGNRGDGPATEALVKPVPDLRGKVEVNEQTTRLVLRGRGSMPGYETTLDRGQVRHVLNHMAKIHASGSTQKPVKPKRDAKGKGKAKADAKAKANPPPAPEGDAQGANP